MARLAGEPAFQVREQRRNDPLGLALERLRALYLLGQEHHQVSREHDYAPFAILRLPGVQRQHARPEGAL